MAKGLSSLHKTEGKATLLTALLLCVALGYYVYFSFCLVTGFDYRGSEDSRAFFVFLGVSDAFCIVAFLKTVIADKVKLSVGSLFLILAMLMILLSLVLGRENFNQYNYLLYFCGYAFPGCFAGIMLMEIGKEKIDYRVVDVLIVLLVAATLCYQLPILLHGWHTRGLASVSYQLVSYLGALAFGLNMWSLSARKTIPRFRLFSTKAFGVLQVIAAVLLPIFVFTSGGRGGAILLLVYCIFFFVRTMKGRASRAVLFFVLFSIAALVVFLIIIELSGGFQLTDNVGLNRLLSRGDNRSEVYAPAIRLFMDSPIFGYGFGAYYDALGGYPHNIILELLLCSGLIGLVIAIVAAFALLHSFVQYSQSNSLLANLVTCIMLFAIVYLSFSGSFLASSAFWFSIGAISVTARERSRTAGLRNMKGC